MVEVKCVAGLTWVATPDSTLDRSSKKALGLSPDVCPNALCSSSAPPS